MIDAAMPPVTLTGTTLTLEDMLAVARDRARAEIDPAALAAEIETGARVAARLATKAQGALTMVGRER